MSFVLLAGALAFTVAYVILRSAMRQGDLMQTQPEDIAIYRAQLSEVDRDLARGVIAETEAEAMRVEISRRLLAADARGATSWKAFSRWQLGVLVFVLILTIFGGGAFLYSRLGAPSARDLPLAARLAAAEQLANSRPTQKEAENTQNADVFEVLPEDIPSDFVQLMERLRKAVASRPGDILGHQLLVQNEARIGNYRAAHKAQLQVIALLGGDVIADEYARYADLLILAVGGYVSPEAEAALRAALDRDPKHGLSRYYIGLLHAQTARPDLAFYTWRNLIRESSPDAPYLEPLSEQIELAAMQAGLMQELQQLEPPRGPSAEDIEAAEGLSADERMEMIQNMVAQLSDRLATTGGTPDEWVRLINAHMVLGENEQAKRVLSEAVQVFNDTPNALSIFNEVRKKLEISP